MGFREERHRGKVHFHHVKDTYCRLDLWVLILITWLRQCLLRFSTVEWLPHSLPASVRYSLEGSCSVQPTLKGWQLGSRPSGWSIYIIWNYFAQNLSFLISFINLFNHLYQWWLMNLYFIFWVMTLMLVYFIAQISSTLVTEAFIWLLVPLNTTVAKLFF